MLYDKRWDSKKNAKKNDAGVFSLQGLIAWLNVSDPDTKYDYWDICNCLLSKYADAIGVAEDARHPLSKLLGDDAGHYHAIAGKTPWTLGAALSRARKIAESA